MFGYTVRVGTRLSVFVLILVVLDVAVILGLKPAQSAPTPLVPGMPGASDPVASDDDVPLDPDWALCLTRFDGKPVTPTSVAITYLDTQLDSGIKPELIRGWFGEPDSMVVDVYKLEQADGRRRISFEITRSKWPEWDRVAGNKTGETVCSAVRAALVAARINRPPSLPSDGQAGADSELSAEAQLAPSRHKYEFIYARRPSIYRKIEWVGTLDHALAEDTYTALHTWLDGGVVP